MNESRNPVLSALVGLLIVSTVSSCSGGTRVDQEPPESSSLEDICSDVVEGTIDEFGAGERFDHDEDVEVVVKTRGTGTDDQVTTCDTDREFYLGGDDWESDLTHQIQFRVVDDPSEPDVSERYCVEVLGQSRFTDSTAFSESTIEVRTVDDRGYCWNYTTGTGMQWAQAVYVDRSMRVVVLWLVLSGERAAGEDNELAERVRDRTEESLREIYEAFTEAA